MLIGDLDARANGKMKTEEIHKKQKGILAVIKKKKRENTERVYGQQWFDNNKEKDGSITSKMSFLEDDFRCKRTK